MFLQLFLTLLWDNPGRRGLGARDREEAGEETRGPIISPGVLRPVWAVPSRSGPLSPTLTLQGGREGNHGIAQSQLTLPREKASEMLDSSLPEAALAGQEYSCAENDIISSI